MFVLSSDREGFPMVLCEAMSAGLPVVARDCDAGPREIIRDGVDGLLAPKGATAELAAAMRRLMADNGLRSRLGREARSVTTRFSADRFFRTWDGIVEDLERKTR